MHDFSALPPSHYDLEWAEATLDQAPLYHHRAACGRHIRCAVQRRVDGVFARGVAASLIEGASLP